MTTLERFSAAALLAAFSLSAAAQQAAKRPMTFQDMMAMHRISDPQPSPDGKWVLFNVQDVDLAKNKKVTHIWEVPADGSAPAKQIGFSQAGESRPRFSPDGQRVLYTATGADGSGQLFAAQFAADGSLHDAVQLTKLSTEADGGMWSPDGKRILFVSEVYPECGADDVCNKKRDDEQAASKVKAKLFTGMMYRHWDHYLNAKRSHLFVMNADGSGIRDLTPASVVGDHEVPTFSLGGPDDYAWAPDSHEVAYVADLDPVPAVSTSKQIYAVRLDDPGSPVKKISTSAGGNFTPRYSPDGKWIAFRSQERAGYESDRFRLALYERSKGTVSYPLPNFDRWVDEIAWDTSSTFLWVASGNHGETDLLALGISGAMRNREARTRELENGEYGDLVVGRDGRLYATRMTVRTPTTIVRSADGYKTSYPRVAEITHLNKDLLAQLDLPPMDPFEFRGALNTPVQGFLIKPPNFDPNKKYPLKFLIHGGPQGAWGDAWSYRWNAELFAADGYLVVMINPRGSTGYGQKFIDQINGDWGGKPFVDLMRGLDYAEAKYPFIDKTRECALGASYGGYMANWVLGHTHRFACIVSHDGMFDPASAYGATEELWFNEWEFKGKPWDYYGKAAALDPYRKWSPALAAKNFKTPTLVIHGQLDYRLDVSQGFDLFTTLQREGVPSEMLYFPDEGHWVLKPQDSELWYKTVNAWCDKWTHTNEAR
jgi:dipeptidyl aminopeptidase/acylaminoacyl peptidase